MTERGFRLVNEAVSTLPGCCKAYAEDSLVWVGYPEGGPVRVTPASFTALVYAPIRGRVPGCQGGGRLRLVGGEEHPLDDAALEGGVRE